MHHLFIPPAAQLVLLVLLHPPIQVLACLAQLARILKSTQLLASNVMPGPTLHLPIPLAAQLVLLVSLHPPIQVLACLAQLARIPR